MRTFLCAHTLTIRQIDVLALEALLHNACGEPQVAIASLRQALALAAPAEITRPFVDMGHEMAALLREATPKAGPQAGFAADVLAAFSENNAADVERRPSAHERWNNLCSNR
ncbi:MAG: hypothetical protein IPK16_29095 [Anaerolineales bacterium]|nr:hypothetical protein [Anaerolineales bacterium]